MAGFLGFIRTYQDAEAYAALERTGEVAELRRFFGPRVTSFTASIERRKREEVLAHPRQLETLLATNPWGAYAGLVQAVPSLGLTSSRRLAMIGCGPLPDSLVCLHRHTEVERLIGFDRDPGSSVLAQELIDGLGLDRIRITSGDGEELDYRDFDVVCPTVFAVPRRAVVERIARTARPGATVIVRDPFFTGTLLFERVLDALPAQLERCAEAPSRAGRFMLGRRHVLKVRATQRRGRP